jgi:hypothetical protein
VALDERREAVKNEKFKRREEEAISAIVTRAHEHKHASKEAENTRAFASRTWLAGLQRKRWKAQQDDLAKHRLDPQRERNVNTKERRYLKWEGKYLEKILAEQAAAKEAAAASEEPRDAAPSRGIIRHIPFYTERPPQIDVDKEDMTALLERATELEARVLYVAGAQGRPKRPLEPVPIPEKMQAEMQKEVDRRRDANLKALAEKREAEGKAMRDRAAEARRKRQEAEEQKQEALKAYRAVLRKQKTGARKSLVKESLAGIVKEEKSNIFEESRISITELLKPDSDEEDS